MVAAGVVLFCGHNVTLGTEMNTEVTFLAMFFINFYVSFQNSIPKKFYVGIIILAGACYLAHNAKKVKFFKIIGMKPKSRITSLLG
jgi:hypothetical protein